MIRSGDKDIVSENDANKSEEGTEKNEMSHAVVITAIVVPAITFVIVVVIIILFLIKRKRKITFDSLIVFIPMRILAIIYIYMYVLTCVIYYFLSR
jgi:hypothetical protein